MDGFNSLCRCTGEQDWEPPWKGLCPKGTSCSALPGATPLLQRRVPSGIHCVDVCGVLHM